MDKNIRIKLLKTFAHMKERCYDTNDRRYKDWGGRGIKICKEWLDDKEKFIEWSLSNGCEINLSLDRINNDGDYCPENCRWVSLAENNQNRRSCRYYTINGIEKNLQQWCNEYNISRSMVNKRLEMGWSIERALNTPKRGRDKNSIVGKRYGRLVVIEASEKTRNRLTLWKCKCDCGKITFVDKVKLESGHSLSCGCLRSDMLKERHNAKLQ